MKVFVLGTLKRGFPLHAAGIADAAYPGTFRTVERVPMFIAGPWFAPMMLNEPGKGLHVTGELYEIIESDLTRIDALESVGRPGNMRVIVEVEPVHGGRPCSAFAYMKERSIAKPIHSDCLEVCDDRRFVPPVQRS